MPAYTNPPLAGADNSFVIHIQSDDCSPSDRGQAYDLTMATVPLEIYILCQGIDNPLHLAIIPPMFVDKAQAFPRRPRPPQTTGLVFVVA